MFKELRSRIAQHKGFTLVELMIVIAIIAILMLVLIPRIGVLRTKSKEAGIKANALMVEGIVRNEIENFTNSDADCTAFQAQVLADINAPATVDTLRNPITGQTGGLLTNAITAQVGGAVTAFKNDNTPTALEVTTGLITTPPADADGMIAIGAYPNGNKLEVQLVAYDETGAVITALSKTISQ